MASGLDQAAQSRNIEQLMLAQLGRLVIERSERGRIESAFMARDAMAGLGVGPARLQLCSTLSRRARRMLV